MNQDRNRLRRRVMKMAVLAAGAALVPRAAHRAHAQAKMGKAQAKYQDQPNDGKRCSACAHFMQPAQCKLVEGKIAPNGWCMLYTARPAGSSS